CRTLARQPVEIDRRRAHQEMIVVAHTTTVRFGLRKVPGVRAERDCVSRTYAGTRRRSARGAAIGAQVALDGMMVDAVVAHRAIGARDHAFAASGAAVLDDADDARRRVLDDRLRIDRARAQTGGSLAVLAGDREEVERGAACIAEPYDLVAVLARPQSVLLLARSFAALAADATLQVDHQREAFHRYHAVRCHQVIGSPPATYPAKNVTVMTWITRPTTNRYASARCSGRHHACCAPTDARVPVRVFSSRTRRA